MRSARRPRVEKLKAGWFDVVESLWFVPALFTLAGGALAILLVRFNDLLLNALGGDELWWIFGGTAGGARSVLQSISGSIITVTGVVFSVTIVALQLASSQFTPRVLRTFTADRANQIVLGVFIATFTFALLVQRTVRSEDAGEEFVPQVAVTVAVLLALTSIGFLIFFVNHIARSIQASVILDSVTDSALRVVRAVYPEERDAREHGPGEHAARGAPARDDRSPCDGEDALEIRALRAGYLQAVERAKLRALAAEHDLLVVVEVEIGRFLLPGFPTMRVRPAGRVSDEVRLAIEGSLVQGPERTPHQDVTHGLLELMEIAVKGLSPGINDPTTAINALQRLSEVWLELARRVNGNGVERDDAGRTRVVLRRPSLAEMVEPPFAQIRHFGGGNPAFAVAAMRIIAELAALSPPHARPVFVRQLEGLIETARERTRADGEDRRHIDREAERSRRIVSAGARAPDLQLPEAPSGDAAATRAVG
jgi:uncharacterized membrane protein